MNPKVLYTGIAIVLALVVVALFFFFPNYLSGGGGNQNQAQNPNAPAIPGAPQAGSQGLVAQDIKVGIGAAAAPGSEVTVSYVGKLQDGTVFDQSSAHGGTFTFVLGSGQVIPGWDQGIAGMKVGGERVLTIPPEMGYGTQGYGPIPPNATLTFDVKLISVKAVSSSTPYAPTGPAAE